MSELGVTRILLKYFSDAGAGAFRFLRVSVEEYRLLLFASIEI
jgi:hypothetical protein